jgi:catechol 2,3-dioxygenase-like lactoylglutathione lyase family enzyme
MIDRFDHLHIQPADFERSLAFYRDTLGWDVLSTWGGPGPGRGAILSGGAIKVVLVERASAPAGGPASCPTIHLDIHDVDRRFEAIPPGEHVVVPPGTSDRGTRWFVVRDPDGNLVAFEEVNRRRD